jgi:polyferredoxin
MSSVLVPRRSKVWSHKVKISRHIFQTAMVLWVAWLVWEKSRPEIGASSPEAFCPFGGFETAWTFVTTGRTVSHVHASNLVLSGVVIILALSARGFFCGWLCPLGAIQEGIRTVGRTIRDSIPVLRKTGHSLNKNLKWLPRVDNTLKYGRYVVLAWALIGAAVTGTMVFRTVDPWSALLSIIDFEFSTGFVVLIIFLFLSLFLDRPFCRYACPLGAIQGLIAKASPVAIQRNAANCLGCTICNDACPMNIPVNTRTRVTDGGCIGCLECVVACPSKDALALTFSFPTHISIVSSQNNWEELDHLSQNKQSGAS